MDKNNFVRIVCEVNLLTIFLKYTRKIYRNKKIKPRGSMKKQLVIAIGLCIILGLCGCSYTKSLNEYELEEKSEGHIDQEHCIEICHKVEDNKYL